DFLPKLNFLHDNGVCQIYAPRPSIMKDKTLLFVSVYKSCGEEMVGLFNEELGLSSVESFAVRCITQEQKSLSSKYFTRQFWQLGGKLKMSQNDLFEPFGKIDNDYISNGNAFRWACRPETRNAPTL
uniref:hypothetical protein n=1 Tax=Herbaspirillum autotrophicum TaxID=180195 RepID=UPI000AD7C227